jgi:hypothetical protein
VPGVVPGIALSYPCGPAAAKELNPLDPEQPLETPVAETERPRQLARAVEGVEAKRGQAPRRDDARALRASTAGPMAAAASLLRVMRALAETVSRPRKSYDSTR